MNKSRIFMVLGTLFLGMYILGAMFRIMHWPLAGPMLLVGSIGAGIFFLLHYSLKAEQSFYDRSLTVIIPLLFSMLVLRIIDSDYRTVYISLAALVSGLFLIYWVLKFTNWDTKLNLRTANWERVLYVLGMVLIIIGIILKYNHLPRASFFLLGGLGITATSYIYGLFSKKSIED